MDIKLYTWRLQVEANVNGHLYFVIRYYIELEVEGKPVEQVSNFVYLSTTISGDGRIDRDLDVRIQSANAKRAFHQDMEQQNYKDPNQDPDLQGCCFHNFIVWS